MNRTLAGCLLEEYFELLEKMYTLSQEQSGTLVYIGVSYDSCVFKRLLLIHGGETLPEQTRGV